MNLFVYNEKTCEVYLSFFGIENEAKGTNAENHNAHFDTDEGVLKLAVAATV